ncbi:hypothetical protein shim_05910 [Shimia sp. SK013]|uniref:hypothetical protein n=1 Tax=Shimia sp. SK013 TaxID=1389006 RepID=UPI0006CC43A0|nr:hypothetical protein [Shimia sp. SK013]KPA22313.1 hypothetical protein shim_05910 [Shimia sp. SK013]
MRRIAVGIGVFVLAAGSVSAAEWQVLSGEEISAMLTDKSAAYDGATQVFYASGRTLYTAGADSWGYWQVRGNQYCSQWPPSGLWDCYGVLVQGQQVRFVAADGSFSDGTLKE